MWVAQQRKKYVFFVFFSRSTLFWYSEWPVPVVRECDCGFERTSARDFERNNLMQYKNTLVFVHSFSRPYTSALLVATTHKWFINFFHASARTVPHSISFLSRFYIWFYDLLTAVSRCLPSLPTKCYADATPCCLHIKNSKQNTKMLEKNAGSVFWDSKIEENDWTNVNGGEIIF